MEVISCRQRERDHEGEEQWKEEECREKMKLNKHGERGKVSSDLVKHDFSDSLLFFFKYYRVAIYGYKSLNIVLWKSR